MGQSSRANQPSGFEANVEYSGGVRGIVELEVLQALERALNPRNGRLRIQNFFDLVIGTR
jgi:hypothetical protein